MARLLTAAAALLASSAAASASTLVRLDSGLQVQGRLAQDVPTVAEFLGIPFAQPPTGSLRWQPPQPYQGAATAQSASAVLNATAMPPSCWQYITKIPTMLTVDLDQFMIGNAGMSEDCLTVSVWTPTAALDADAEKLPVVIWFYGGGFATGGTDVPYQIPSNWVARSQSHIVVVFNYRMNIFGFPTAAGLTEQNLGLLDQRLAVEWISANIASFGGDADRMVIWGQSAGSVAVDLYNFAYPDDPLVTGIIMDSGTAHLDLLLNSNADDYSSFSLVAANLGCGNTSSAAAELECMMKVPAEDLEGFVAEYEDSGASPSLTFDPVRDDKLVFTNYTERAAMGALADLPAMIGFNENEGMFLTAYNATNPDFATALEYSYDYFWCPTTKTTYERLAANRTTHRYFQTGNFTNISPRWWMGAYHGSELPLVFGTHMQFRGNSTPFEYAASHHLQDLYLAFIQDPVNGLDAVGWPAYKAPGGDVFQWLDMSNNTLGHLRSLTEIEQNCKSMGLA